MASDVTGWQAWKALIEGRLHAKVADLTALKALSGTDLVDQMIYPCNDIGTGKGGLYQYDADDTTTPSDEPDVVVVTAGGRMILQGAQSRNLEYAGAYAGGTTYRLNEVVTSGGSCYASLQAGNVGHTPGAGGSETWWGLLAAKGDAGAPGAIPKGSVSTVGLQGAVTPGGSNTGIGSMTATKTGTPKRTGTMRIEITTAGDVGAAKFKWRRNGGAWQTNSEAGYTTGASVSLTQDDAVNIGATTQFLAGVGEGNDFEVGDTFDFDVTHEATVDGLNAIKATFDLITPPGEGDQIILNHSGVTDASVVHFDREPTYGTRTKGLAHVSAGGSGPSAGKITLVIWNEDDPGNPFDGTFIASLFVVP